MVELTQAIAEALRDQTLPQLLKTWGPEMVQQWIISHSHILGAESFSALNAALRAALRAA